LFEPVVLLFDVLFEPSEVSSSHELQPAKTTTTIIQSLRIIFSVMVFCPIGLQG